MDIRFPIIHWLQIWNFFARSRFYRPLERLKVLRTKIQPLSINHIYTPQHQCRVCSQISCGLSKLLLRRGLFLALRIWRNAKISWNAEKSVGIAAKVELNYTLAFLKFRSLLCVLFQRNFHIFLPTFRGGACTTCAFPGDSPTVVKILRGATLIR